jgi:hypothetical protein
MVRIESLRDRHPDLQVNNDPTNSMVFCANQMTIKKKG